MSRFVAAWLALSLVATVVVPSARGTGGADRYADWLRSQVRTDVSDAFEYALEKAEVSKARSLGQFLNVFVAAYAEQASGETLPGYFGAPVDTELALIPYLESRFLQLAGDAVLPRTVVVAAATSYGSSDVRGAASCADAAHAGISPLSFDLPLGERQTDIPVSIRELTLEWPMGP
jgi:hypothetical protein